MSEPAAAVDTPPEAETKELYEIGEIPPLGHVPSKMYGWAIRRKKQLLVLRHRHQIHAHADGGDQNVKERRPDP